jgi:N-acetylmuramate 1-kinase
MVTRITQLNKWLAGHIETKEILVPLAYDASFRRYYRINDGKNSYVVMDAPPDKEDCQPFIYVANLLQQAGLNVPQILAQDLRHGFLLLTDLGTTVYSTILKSGDQAKIDKLYKNAIQALILMQKIADNLPAYDQQLIEREMRLFDTWLISKCLDHNLSSQDMQALQACYNQLQQTMLEQPVVFVHRDYHSRNLMVLDNLQPGILDFQDAVNGAITYDIVSLLRDCYQVWDAEYVQYWLDYYYQIAIENKILSPATSREQLQIWFDYTGIQRHLKASGIFARLHLRDANPNFLQYIPDTLGYIQQVATLYPQLQFLAHLAAELIPEISKYEQ